MDNHLDILHKLALDKGINRRERDMLIALKAFDFENSNVISVGLQTLLDYFCIKNKECIYSVLRALQSKNYIRIEKKNGINAISISLSLLLIPLSNASLCNILVLSILQVGIEDLLHQCEYTIM